MNAPSQEEMTLHRLSLAGRIHKRIPEYVLQLPFYWSMKISYVSLLSFVWTSKYMSAMGGYCIVLCMRLIIMCLSQTSLQSSIFLENIIDPISTKLCKSQCEIDSSNVLSCDYASQQA